MDENLVKQIHQKPYKFYIAATGGGQSFITEFTKIEGASANLIGGIIPYNQKMFDDFIGGKSPAKYVSFEGASKLANASYLQCLKFGVDKREAVGIGVSSALVQASERVGRQHRSFIVVHTTTGTYSLEVVLIKADRTRVEEEEIVCNMILNVLAHILDICPLENFEEKYKFLHTNFRKETDINLGYLINGETDLISSKNLAQEKSICVYCGSFNPIHEAHLKIYSTAKEILGQEVYFEISTKPFGKGILNFIELEDRINQFEKYEFILTNLTKFVDKFKAISKYAPLANITFIMGKDTFDRIEESDYNFFIEKNVKFLVFPRGGEIVNSNEKTVKLLIHLEQVNNIDIPNISSSEIRKKQV